MTTPAILALLATLAINLLATAAVLRASDLESRQRALQIVLIWLVPLVGATVVLLVRCSSGTTKQRAMSRCVLNASR
jgi:hypothetical protein